MQGNTHTRMRTHTHPRAHTHTHTHTHFYYYPRIAAENGEAHSRNRHNNVCEHVGLHAYQRLYHTPQEHHIPGSSCAGCPGTHTTLLIQASGLHDEPDEVELVELLVRTVYLASIGTSTAHSK